MIFMGVDITDLCHKIMLVFMAKMNLKDIYVLY